MNVGDLVMSTENSYMKPLFGLYLGVDKSYRDKDFHFVCHMILTCHGVNELLIFEDEEEDFLYVVSKYGD